MMTSNRDFNPSLSKYNSRKRELHTSMLEYSERFRKLHLKDVDQKLQVDQPPLEIRAHRQRIIRQDEEKELKSDGSVDSVVSKPRRQRPLSLDEKELARNKSLNKSLVHASRRNVKSEYGKPEVVKIPSLYSFPPVSGPPNSPDYQLQDKSDNSKIHLRIVSSSDLFDIVDIDNNGYNKNSARHPSPLRVRMSDGREVMNFIENIDMKNKQVRRTAWGKNTNNQNGKDDHSFYNDVTRNDHSRKSNSKLDLISNEDKNKLAGFIAGKHIPNNNKKSRIQKNPPLDQLEIHNITKDSQRQPDLRSKQNLRSSEPLPSISKSRKQIDKNKNTTSDQDNPLNVFLQMVASSCPISLDKLRHRPKRAKRMQLHKSELVVIPENGNLSKNDLSISTESIFSQNSTPRRSTPVPSNNSLNAIRKGLEQNKKSKIGSLSITDEKDVNGCNIEVRGGHENILNEMDDLIVGVSDKGSHSRLDIQRNGFELKSGNQLDSCLQIVSTDPVTPHHRKKSRKEAELIREAIQLKNSSIYPILPWEVDGNNLSKLEDEMGGRLQENEQLTNGTSGRHRNVKRLIFLRDQPEQTYRR